MKRTTKRQVGTVVGLDLSLRQAAAVVIPPDWDLEWHSLKTLVWGGGLPYTAPESDRLDRLHWMKQQVYGFCVDNNARHVFVEQYAFSQGQSQAHALGELGGVIKLTLHEHLRIWGIKPAREIAGEGVWTLQTVTASQARKFLLGKVPAKGAKDFTHVRLQAMGAPFKTQDETDAFVVANWGQSELGRVALACGE